MKITTDHWHGVNNNEKTIMVSDLALLDKLICDLDGNVRTMVSVIHDGMTVVIGGGPIVVVCTVSLSDGRMFTLVNEERQKDETVIELKAGGQFGEYMAKYLCDKNKVASVVRKIVNDGLKQEGIIWESD